MIMQKAHQYSRRVVLAGGGAAALLASGRSTFSQSDWPNRTVTTLVPYAPGGATDILTRVATQFLSEKFKRPFIVENRVGGSGALATVAGANAAPDGHTLLMSAPQIVTAPMMEKVPYDPNALTPISNFANYPMFLAIKGSLPAKTPDEFIAYAKSMPGKLNYSSAGIGTTSHMVSALFCARAGINVVHIPYRGASP